MEKSQQYETATATPTTTATQPLIHSTSTWISNKNSNTIPSSIDPLRTTLFDSLANTRFDNSSNTSSNNQSNSSKVIYNIINSNSNSSSNHISQNTHLHINDPLSLGDNNILDYGHSSVNNLEDQTSTFTDRNQLFADPLQQIMKQDYQDMNHSHETFVDNNNAGEFAQDSGAKFESGHDLTTHYDPFENTPGILKTNNDDNHTLANGHRDVVSNPVNSSYSYQESILSAESTLKREYIKHSDNVQEKAVHDIIANPLSLINENEHNPLRQPQRRPSRPRTLSSPVQSRVKPLEHLTNMGPLELEREIDSGIHLNMESALSSPTSLLSKQSLNSDPIHTAAESAIGKHHLSHQQSTSTLVSESSRPSSSATKRTEHDNDAEGMPWSGAHPLLMSYSDEPELLDDDGDYSQKAKNRSIARSKGHSMSVDVRQSSSRYHETQDDTFVSRSADIVRRSLTKVSEDPVQDLRVNSDLEQDRDFKPSGKRVIIHQVTTTDTLAGIALFYGIQVSVLKKSNKLWTNDSIHTRKYLYIPFEECTVTRQSGVMVDESNRTVLLPQRIQQPIRQHSRSGSVMSPGSQPSTYTGRMSTYESSIGLANNSIPSAPRTNNLKANMESELVSTVGLSFVPENRGSILHPPISAVAAGMLPSSPLANSPSRMGTWIDSKGTAAPPLPSPTFTTTTSKSDNSLRAALSSFRRNTTDCLGSSSSASGLVPFSEELPDTVIVSPSMTHESLAARFKEMDIISSEQQQRKQLGQEQELRINPIHQRHRTTDLRHLASKQHIVDPGKTSLPTSTTGSRRASVDVGTHGSNPDSVLDSAGRRLLDDGVDSSLIIEEELESGRDYKEGERLIDEENDPNRFVKYGHHQHIYETDDLITGSDQQSDHNDSNALRRQELVTIPAGMLSFFPSSEHSKKLETPQSISRIQNQMDEYNRLSPSLSSSSSSSSFREALSSNDGSRFGAATGKSKSEGRKALNDQTFQLPRGQSGEAHTQSSAYTKDTPSSSSDILHNSSDKNKSSAYTKSLRLNSQYQQQTFTPQKWSAMGESLVDDLLGAVRGPLQIARRVYNFTTFGFGGSNSNSSKDNLDYDSNLSSTNSSTAGLRRKSSSRGRRSQRNKEYRYSGSAIELDQAIFQRPDTTTSNPPPVHSSPESIISNAKGIEPAITRRVPTAPPVNIDVSNAVNGGQSGKSSRRKSSSGHGHFSGSSSGSTRKRSLRSSNPVNHAALMALVNELDKDKREKEKEKDISPAPLTNPLTTSV